jgi:hypothetical protein
MKSWIVLLSILILGAASCTKDDDYDYRDKYTGNYRFEIHYVYPTFPSIMELVYVDTGYYYDGIIEKSTQFKNKIIVDWGNDTVYDSNVLVWQKSELTVDSMGILTYPEIDDNYVRFSQRSNISGDSILFDYSIGNRFTASWHVLGIKQ